MERREGANARIRMLTPYERAEEEIKKTLPEEKVLFFLPSDMSLQGEFTKGWLAVTDKELIYLKDRECEEDQRLEIISKLSMDSLSNVKAVMLVGGGQLEAEIDGELTVLVRYSSGLQPRYSQLERYLTRIIDGEQVASIPDIEESTCSKCGRVFPDESRICPNCINKFKVLLRLLSILKPYISLMVGTLAIFWILTGIRLVMPQLQRLLIDDLLRAGKKDLNLLLLYVGAMAAGRVISVGLTIIRSRLMVKLSNNLSRDLRNMVYAKIQALSLSFISQKKTGDLMNRVTGDTNTIRSFLERHAVEWINEGLIFIGVVIILLISDWRLAILVLLPAPFVVLYSKMIWDKVRSMQRYERKLWDKSNSILQDTLSGARVVKAFGQEEREVDRFKISAHDFAKATARNEKLFNTLYPTLGFIMGLGNFFVMYFGGKLVWGNEMKLGELVQFTAYASMIYGPLQYLSFIPRWFTSAMTAAERIFEVIDEEPDVKDAINPMRLPRIQGEVSFDDVTFGYQKHEPVLKDINLNVQPGEMIGLVGHSGAGKSTLINLLNRFYDVDEGSITIDGVDIRQISQNELRSQIGVVLQETFLFSGTVWENIAYSKPGAKADEIIRAAKIANAHDFIMRFSDGYDTKVGERGQRLSGGERQRIAIARAILHNPRILILDEATSSVDTQTEKQIQEALGRLIQNRTTFAIAHRLSTLRNATRLLVLEKGKMVELGTHEELIKARGTYFKLVMAQREMSRIRWIDG
jgi:ATP-binding cassette subfamily B protein